MGKKKSRLTRSELIANAVEAMDAEMIALPDDGARGEALLRLIGEMTDHTSMDDAADILLGHMGQDHS